VVHLGMATLRRAALALLLGSAAAAPRNQEVVPRTELSHPCSRAVSRSVRRLLEKDILRPAQKAGVDAWAPGCPFDPALDLWGKHERQKSRKRGSGSHWACGICGKVFQSEHYIDLHMERKHMNETPRGGVCLANYCEMFEVCQGDSKFKRRKDQEPECDNETMQQVRHSCEEAMNRCFPLGQESSRILNAKFSRQYCRVLDCRIRAEQKNEHHMDLMPVIVLLILIVLICFMVFSLVVCCVDYSDDIFQILVSSGIVSSGFVKKATKARNDARKPLGLDRTKCV